MSLIRIFTVGGTIDKIYFDAKSSYEVGLRISPKYFLALA
jgi:hypothetical protein